MIIIGRPLPPTSSRSSARVASPRHRSLFSYAGAASANILQSNSSSSLTQPVNVLLRQLNLERLPKPATHRAFRPVPPRLTPGCADVTASSVGPSGGIHQDLARRSPHYPQQLTLGSLLSADHAGPHGNMPGFHISHKLTQSGSFVTEPASICGHPYAGPRHLKRHHRVCVFLRPAL